MDKLMKEWKKVLEQDLAHIAQEVKDELERPCVIFLEGPLGAGKTTFAKSFVGKPIQSPSYNLILEYDHLLHGDFYRLEREQELSPLELPYLLEQKEIFLVEWGYRWLSSLLSHVPDHFHYYKLTLALRPGQPELRDIKLCSVAPYL